MPEKNIWLGRRFRQRLFPQVEKSLGASAAFQKKQDCCIKYSTTCRIHGFSYFFLLMVQCVQFSSGTKGYEKHVVLNPSLFVNVIELLKLKGDVCMIPHAAVTLFRKIPFHIIILT